MGKKVLKRLLSLSLCLVLMFIPVMSVNAQDVGTDVDPSSERAVLYLTETHNGNYVGLKVEIAIQDSTGQINSCKALEYVNVSPLATNIYAGSPIYSSDRRSVYYNVSYKFAGVATNEVITIR